MKSVQYTKLLEYVAKFKLTFNSEMDIEHLFSFLTPQQQFCFLHEIEAEVFSLDNVDWEQIIEKYSPLSLGDRMKMYEKRLRHQMSSDNHIVVRLDGVNFKSYTKAFNKPFDVVLMDIMKNVMLDVAKQFNAVLGYTQSDEITLYIHRPNGNRQIHRNGVVNKINTDFSVFASNRFQFHYQKHLMSINAFDIDTYKFASFDCRCMEFNTDSEVLNNLMFRQQDWRRNNIAMVAQSEYSTSELHRKNRDDMYSMLLLRGIDFGVDYDLSIHRGTFVYKRNLEKLNNDEVRYVRSHYTLGVSPLFDKHFKFSDYGID